MNKKRFECKKTLACVRCGDCCHIRQSELINLSDEEDFKIRKKVYENTGVIYLYPLKQYTLSLTKEEKASLEAEAKKLKIKVKIKPKRIVINQNQTKAEVLDYFLDHDICPFLKGKNFCLIYISRPQVCRIFPHIMKYDTINPSILVEKDSNFNRILNKAKQLVKTR